MKAEESMEKMLDTKKSSIIQKYLWRTYYVPDPGLDAKQSLRSEGTQKNTVLSRVGKEQGLVSRAKCCSKARCGEK